MHYHEIHPSWLSCFKRMEMRFQIELRCTHGNPDQQTHTRTFLSMAKFVPQSYHSVLKWKYHRHVFFRLFGEALNQFRLAFCQNDLIPSWVDWNISKLTTTSFITLFVTNRVLQSEKTTLCKRLRLKRCHGKSRIGHRRRLLANRRANLFSSQCEKIYDGALLN